MKRGCRRIITSSRKVLIGISIFTAVCTALFALPVHALHEDASADLPGFFLLFWCVTGMCWLMVTEHACFTGLAVKGDYLVLAKSLLIPVRRYIRLDQVKQLRSKRGSEMMHVRRRSVPIMNNVRYLVRMPSGKTFRSSLLYREMYDDGVHTGPIWGAKTEKCIVDTTQKLTYWRIAWDALALRILVAVLASLPFQPWRFFV